ncbi:MULTISPECIES: BspA family leucine-rich repeat surface protein [unclassified Lactobacillus]|uniref:BspA family leucine-rich repeat surface protein n=1 Tax=unclassified Lactobacillus TaxID=2620435 RepID=UPI0018DD6B0B|nr:MULTISPECIES: BspA family leucine-rich repeat surface protein [unclassified Lactobacillus]MBH9988809.1 BspA family leucine-rich repeat surface protein [Lactobacillus sp. M0392]MBI0023572.1 BspA family leucine-rich repeat surface protein [Lactobacillus sp. W8171]MBI0043977.1 BspA family leucine-rich repeat surface protein [Lactobacillus sp. M0393]
MNKGLDRNKRTGALLFSSLTAAALGLTILNTNVVKADSNSGAQDTAQNFDKNDSRVKTRVANSTVSQENNQGVTTDNANTTAPEGNANGTTNNADETQNGSVDSPQGNNKNSNSQTSAGNDQPETDITKNENKISTKTIKTGKWGNADVSYDSDTNVLTVSGSHDKENPTIVSNAGLVSGFLGQDGPDPECTHVKKVIFDGYFKVVGNTRSVFLRLRGLTDIENLENVDTSEATNMYAWFAQCSSLKHVDLSHFNTSNVKNMNSMFEACTNLEELDLSKFDTSQVRDMSYMFAGCESLKELDLQNFNTSQVTDMSFMFAECKGLEKLNVTSFDTSKVKNMEYMFNCCASLPTVDVHNFNTSNVTNMAAMFCMYYFHISGTGQVFGWDSKLTSLDLSNFDTSNVTDMGGMFFKCTKLKDLNISNFDTSKVTTMNSMFQACNKLTSLDLSNFNTANVTDMYGMFRDTNSLISLNVSSFDTRNVTNMGQMFYLYVDTSKNKYPELSNLRTLDISNFKISDNTYCGYMLKGQAGLLVLKLGDEVKNFSQMGLDTPGTWLNVGTRTIQHPEGKDQWPSDELMKNWNGKKETYVRQATITAYYQDEKGNKLADDETFTGTYGTNYDFKKDIPGYTLIATRGKVSGTIGKELDDVTFVYKKDDSGSNGSGSNDSGSNDSGSNDSGSNGSGSNNSGSNNSGSNGHGTNSGINDNNTVARVEVHYQDENDNEIAPSKVLTGVVGEGYITKALDITGYTLKLRPVNATGFFSSQPQTVTYVYSRNGVIRTVRHNSYLYDQNGGRKAGEYFIGKKIKTYGSRLIQNKKYYELGNDTFVKANNVTGIKRKLKHNAYIYTRKANKKVKRSGRKVLKKKQTIRTYGGAIKMHNKLYYIVGKNRYIKKANF